MRWLQALVVCSLLFATSAVRADGLIQKLPADGSWAKYRLELTINTSDGERTLHSTITIRSVGKLEEKGEKCRWIEIAFDGPDHKSVVKLLMLEKDLKKGKNPLSSMVRGWWKESEASAVEPLSDPEKRPFLPALTGGPVENAKAADAAVFEFPQLGKVELAGVIGTRRQERDQLVIESRHELRFSDRTPFGGVAINGEFVGKQEGVERFKGKFTIKLVDMGNDAKSDLADWN